LIVESPGWAEVVQSGRYQPLSRGPCISQSLYKTEAKARIMVANLDRFVWSAVLPMVSKAQLDYARRLQAASGYLDLEMPDHALRALDGIVHPETTPFEFHLLRHRLAVLDLLRIGRTKSHPDPPAQIKTQSVREHRIEKPGIRHTLDVEQVQRGCCRGRHITENHLLPGVCLGLNDLVRNLRDGIGHADDRPPPVRPKGGS